MMTIKQQTGDNWTVSLVTIFNEKQPFFRKLLGYNILLFLK
jgi:hypothetical protein